MKVLTGLGEALTGLDGQIVLEPDRLGLGVVQSTMLRPDGDYDIVIARPDGRLETVQVAPIRVRSLIANCLARAQSKEPVRAMDVALRIHRCNGKIELDDVDVEMVKEAVLGDQALTNIAKAAALEALDAPDGEVKNATEG